MKYLDVFLFEFNKEVKNKHYWIKSNIKLYDSFIDVYKCKLCNTLSIAKIKDHYFPPIYTHYVRHDEEINMTCNEFLIRNIIK